MRLGAISGPHAGRVLDVHDTLTLGRSSDCHLTLDDPKVSRRHATCWPSGPVLRIRDEASLNGTWLNDERIDGEGTLRAGDRLRIGGSEFVVQEDRAGEAPAVPDAAAWADAEAPALAGAGVSRHLTTVLGSHLDHEDRDG